MNQGLSGLVSLVGLASSLLGMGTSTASQINMMRAQNRQAVVQQCPPNTTRTIVTMADGSQGVVCYEQREAGK